MNKLKNYLLDKGLEFRVHEHFNNGVFVEKSILVSSFRGAVLIITKRDGYYRLIRIDGQGNTGEPKTLQNIDALFAEIRDMLDEDRKASTETEKDDKPKEEPRKRTKEDKQ